MVLRYEGPELGRQRALPFPSFVGILHAFLQGHLLQAAPLVASPHPSSSALMPLQALAALKAPAGREFLATFFFPSLLPSYLSSFSPSLIFIFIKIIHADS